MLSQAWNISNNFATELYRIQMTSNSFRRLNPATKGCWSIQLMVVCFTFRIRQEAEHLLKCYGAEAPKVSGAAQQKNPSGVSGSMFFIGKDKGTNSNRFS